MESKLIKTIFFSSVVWLSGAILTQDALGADTVIYVIRSGGAVGTLDLNSGDFTQLSSTPVAVTGLGEYGGVLYGSSLGCDCLFQIDPTTAATVVAPHTFHQNNNNFGAQNGFGSTTAGLFIIGAAPGIPNTLYSVDPATGDPVMIGSTGVIAGGGTGYLSASDDASQLYWEVQINCTDTLYSINPSTGAATTIGSASTCVLPSTPGSPTALVLTGGTLWANFSGKGFGTISTTSGAQTLVSTDATPTFVAFAPFPLLPPTPVLVGSMGHLAAEENWTSTFTLVNKGVAPSQAMLSFFGDASDPTGDGPLALPLIFPQVSTTAVTAPTASVSQSMAANASLVIQTAGPQTPPVLVGSAQLAAAGRVDGFAIFHQIPTAQEAVVPMDTRNAGSYLLAFDNTNGVVLGVAVDNVAASAGNVGVIIRDDTGAQLTTASLAVSANGHSSFVLSTQYPMTANKRGTVEFDTPPGGQISVLGIRFTPPNNALTTIPALANVGTAGGSIAHIATGNGWQTTFVLVNTGTSLAPVTLKFFADLTGGPLTIPVSFPQIPGGTVSLVSSVSQPLNPGATLVIQSAAPLSDPTPTVGSAQLTTTGNVGGFVIFRYNPNGQEAVVPLESRNAGAYLLAFDNTSQTATGVAINSVSAQGANIPVVVRNDAGVQIATDTVSLAANGHLAFTLAVDKYPAAAGIRGTIEFDTPAGAQIGALGIRIPVAHTFTTLPALAK